MRLDARNLYVSAPEKSTLLLFNANGELCLRRDVGMNTNVSLEKLSSGKWLAKVVSASGKTLSAQMLSLR